jgi:hypothetical protein
VRPSSAALAAYLAANDSVVIADLYTFVLTSGEVVRYSGWTTALGVAVTSFPNDSVNFATGGSVEFVLGPRFGRSKAGVKLGVEPTELDIEILAGANDLVGTFAFAEAVRLGIFDGATLELDRLFAPPQAAGSAALDTSLGALVWFYGRVAEAEIGRSKIAMKVKSLMNLLAIQQMPRRLYQASCGHVFGDAMCGYNRVTGTAANGTAGGPAQITVTVTTTDQALITCSAAVASEYVEGTIAGATGANTGYRRTVANNGDGSQIGLFKPFLYPIAIGDTFTVLPGCDHTTGSGGCAGRNNLARFGGFPYIPPPELAV